MRNKLKKVFGIDFGTTYSSIAYVNDHGEAVVVPNAENELATPSVVFFDGNDIIVGNVAKDSSRMYPDKVVTCVKRHMGDPNFSFSHNSKTYRVEEIASFIIRKLVQDAEQYLGEEITDIVITCPAYFGINEREATRIAGEIAGYNVRQIINEPTAAAITYGFMSFDVEKDVLVYDLGGGTFDITMINIQPDSLNVICTGGSQNLGGKDWDDRIVQHLADQFQKNTGARVNILDDPDTYQDLQITAEKTKKTLSHRQIAPVLISYMGKKAKIEMARKEFEEFTQALINRTIAFTRDVLEEAAKKGYKDFDEIIFVGGSTRMPLVAKRVEQELSKTPRVFAPDEAVSKGAAICGWKFSLHDGLAKRIAKKTGMDFTPGDGETDAADVIGVATEQLIKETAQEMADELGFDLLTMQRSMISIVDVASKSFGIVVKNPADKEKIVYNLIQKNTTVPTNYTRAFYTGVENQEKVMVRIMENDKCEKHVPIDDSVHIGTAMMILPPGMPRKSPVVIYFYLDEEGCLQITAEEPNTFSSVEAIITTESVIHGKDLKQAMERHDEINVN